MTTTAIRQSLRWPMPPLSTRRPRPQASGRRHHSDRRAVPAGAAGGCPRVRDPRDATWHSKASKGRQRSTSCFGYAAVVHDRPTSGYSYLGQLNDSVVQQISIETAQPRLDYGVLDQLPDKHIILGALDLGDPEVEQPETVAERIRSAFRYVPAGAIDDRTRLRDEVPQSCDGVREAPRDGRGDAARARRARLTQDGAVARRAAVPVRALVAPPPPEYTELVASDPAMLE